MKRHWAILVVDDEEVMRESLAVWLREDGYRVDTAASGREAVEKAGQKEYAIYFIDLKMPGGMDGIETMMEVRKLHADAPIVIITAYATVDTAITAMKEGAHEYIVKPCNPQEISLLVDRIIKVKNLQRENLALRKQLNRQYRLQDIVGKSAAMQVVFERIHQAAPLSNTVLVQGENGTGKELVARAIHYSGNRASGPFVRVTCAGMPESLIQSVFCGGERDDSSEATAKETGCLEKAGGGTLFLREIGGSTPGLQLELARILKERHDSRGGRGGEVPIDARIVASTSMDLADAVKDGGFREDLFGLLNDIRIYIPPLRERLDDIPLLAANLLERLSLESGKEVGGISEAALGVLMDHDWPGNVRELEQAIGRAVLTGKSRLLTQEDFAFLTPRGRER